MAKGKDKKNESTALVPATQSNFAQESAAAAAAVNRPSNAMIALFQQRSAETALEGLTRKNMPQMIKAVDNGVENIPVGGLVTGVIVDVVKSPVSTIKGSLLWLHLVKQGESGKWEKTGLEITFPATGVIRAALAPGVDGEENARKEMLKLRGHLFAAQRMPNKVNKNYNKEMTTWDVRTSPKPVADELEVKINS
jgi:hypothetical protein